MNANDLQRAREALFPILRERARNPLPLFLRAWILTMLPLAAALALLALHPGQPALWVAAAVVAGLTQNALGILMHEGCHHFFHRSKAANDVLANLLVCLPIFNTVEGYRRDHFEHHRSSGKTADPYFELYGGYPSRSHLVRGLLADCLGLSAARKFFGRYGNAAAGGKPVRNPRYALPAFLAIHAALAGVLYAVTGRWFAYAALWLAPLLTLPIAINRLRTVVEHYPGFAGGKANRTTITGMFEYLCIAPYGYAHHLVHHVWPLIPYYELGFAHRFLVAHGVAFTDNDVNAAGYLRAFHRLLGEMGTPGAVHEG